MSQGPAERRHMYAKDNGTWVAVTCDDDGLLIEKPYGIAIAEGDAALTGHEKWKVIGYRSALGTTEAHLALGAAGRFVWPAVAQTFWVVSSSANDDGAPVGSGAQTIDFWGINAAGNEANETIILNGVTRVVTVGTYLAPVIDKTKVNAVGATGWNEGTITCYDAAAAGNVVWAMNIGTNQAAGSVYYVPTGKTAYLWKTLWEESSNVGVTFRLYVKEPGDPCFYRRDLWMTRESAMTDLFQIPPDYAAGTRMEVTGQALGPNCTCGLKFLGWIE